MNLARAKYQITQTHPNINPEVKKNVFNALESLENFLPRFKSEHVEKIYEIEIINPSYFPGLSIAAARTFKDLQLGNPNLSLDFILKTVNRLAHRGRPWESLVAFSELGKHCGTAITEESINHLLTINSNVLEIIGFSIRNKIDSPEVENGSDAKPYIQKLLHEYPDLVRALNAVFSSKKPAAIASLSTNRSHAKPVNLNWYVLNGFIAAMGISVVAIALVALTPLNFGAGLAVGILGGALMSFGLWRSAKIEEPISTSLALNL